MFAIASQNSTASFAPDSALQSFIVDGHELVGSWPGSNGKPSSSMTMFPCVGMVSTSGKFVYKGETYTPGKHGYLRGRAMEVLQPAKLPRIIFKHHHLPEKEIGLYPIENTATVTHEIEGDALATYLSVFNNGLADMYFGAGLHPAFMWGADANGDHGDSRITLSEVLPQGTAIYRTVDGVVSTKNRDDNAFEGGKVLRLRPSDFQKDAFFVVMPEDQRGGTIKIVFSCPHNAFDIQVVLEGWDGFGIWSKPGAGSTFLCIEPLVGVARTDLAPSEMPALEDIIGLRKLSPSRKFFASMHVRPIFKGLFD